MAPDPTRQTQLTALPLYAPKVVRQYLAHVGAGLSLRDMAKITACHPSTMMRRIRRVEQSRDDPLVDAALRRLEDMLQPQKPDFRRRVEKELASMRSSKAEVDGSDRSPNFEKEAMRALRRLCETGAVLAIAADMDMAVIVREAECGSPTRTAVVAQHIAQDMALEGWIETTGSGRILRYSVTPSGREALRAHLGESQETTALSTNVTEFAEAAAHFEPAPRIYGERTIRDETGQPRKVRYNLSDSPLTALARRRDKLGAPFLSDDLVRCGERLREDFELAQMQQSPAQDWHSLNSEALTNTDEATKPIYGPEAARGRVVAALHDLGPGLSDVALRCCCYLEGLESAEQRMGWSARSGKIVLRIALQRLKRHYDDTLTPENQMIG